MASRLFPDTFLAKPSNVLALNVDANRSGGISMMADVGSIQGVVGYT